MKKHFKVLTGIFAGVIATVVLVTAGAYANEKGWFNFTGQERAEESESHIDEIMQILRDTHDGKISAENALVELEALNPAGLAKQNKELRNQVEKLKTDNAQLVTDLNAKQKEVNNKQTEIEQKQQEIKEKNQAYDQLQQERDEVVSARDEAIAKRDEIQVQLDLKNEGYRVLQEELTQANEYIEHLEAQVTEANNAVNNVYNTSSEAVEEARTFKE